MAGLVPVDKRRGGFVRTGFDNFPSILDDFFGDPWLPNRNMLRDIFKVDVRDEDSAYKIEADVPGLTKEEVDLSVEDKDLIISVNKKEEKNEESENYIHRERRTSSMSRRLRLADANLDEVKAELKDGVLCVTVPKKDAGEAVKKIDIQ